MKYTVVWSPRAENDLANHWTTANNRNEVARIAQRIDASLRDSPLDQGESRAAGRRIAFFGDFVVLFVVEESDRTVRVEYLRSARR